MKFAKRFAAALALMLGMTGGVVALTSLPSSAHGESCPALAVCVWETSSWSGASYYWTTPTSGSCTNTAGAWNDRASSAKINYGSVFAYMILYKNANCTGATIATATKQGSGQTLINCGNLYNQNWNNDDFPCNTDDVSSFFYHY